MMTDETGLTMPDDEAVILRAVSALDATDCAAIRGTTPAAPRDDLTRNVMAERLIERLRALSGGAPPATQTTDTTEE
jgi:hypothetical protein